MTYVYPVVSRRAGGVSVGINLNPNAACNWRCVYCQVPNLTRGSGPGVDQCLLEQELMRLLRELVEGDFMVRRVPEGLRRLQDVAFSGDGEPTTSPDLLTSFETVERVLERFALLGKLAVVMITNGSMAGRPQVSEALRRLARMNGEAWFKLDRGTRHALQATHSVPLDPERQFERLERCASLCPTWVQTCMFQWDGAPPGGAELDAYCALMARAARLPGLRGVHLYGLARRSHQPEASRLSPVSGSWLEELGERLRSLSLVVRVSP